MMKLNFENHSTYTNPEDIKRLGFVVNIIRELIGDSGKVLDLGCGKGNMSIQLAMMGYDVTGIDSDKASIEYAQSVLKRPNLKFIICTLEDYHFEAQSADVIIVSEVLEHLVNPVGLIDRISTVIKQDGIIIVTVPNGRGPREMLVTRPFLYFSKHFTPFFKGLLSLKKMLGYTGTNQSKSENLEHLHFFTLKQIHQLANKNGFEIIRKGKSIFIENTFPISLLTNRIHILKELDTRIADYLPYFMVSGFFTVWKKKAQS